jgi:NitT/TauT family transport system ATP-binding protein
MNDNVLVTERSVAAAAAACGGIAIRGVRVVYGSQASDAVTALEHIDLDIAPGEFVSLVGPSGCGKSTLLKVVGDLIAPTAGSVTIAGTSSATLRRQGRIGLVFQQANLMPWLRVEANVRLLYEIVAQKGSAGGRSAPNVTEILELVGLTGFEHKLPHQLSGGMQQRAALARALALDPAILLMDEPFAALDEITRDRMAFELMRIWAHWRKTVLFVTHSLAEAVFLSDRIALMTPRPGRIHRTYAIDLKRPRNHETRLSDGFAHLTSELSRELYRIMTDPRKR